MKTPLLLLFAIFAVMNCTACAETPPATFLIGSERIKVSPPFGFSECSKTTPFLSRYFAFLVLPNQFPLGGFLTDREVQFASTGAEPALWHVAFAYSMEEYRKETLRAADFAELRKHHRDNINKVVQVTEDKSRKRFEEFGASASGSLSSGGIFLDDASSFAFIAKSSGGARAGINATAFVLVRGKIIGLSLGKVYSSDIDIEWTKAAMKWWIDKLRSDNP